MGKTVIKGLKHFEIENNENHPKMYTFKET